MVGVTLVTTIFKLEAVVELPAASRAIAVIICAPLLTEVVSQLILYGAVVS